MKENSTSSDFSRREFIKIAAVTGLATLIEFTPLGRITSALAEAKNTTLPQKNNPFTQVETMQRFTDIATSPYCDAIVEMSEKGIIDGYPDGTFRPNNPVTRAQFAKMIDLTLGLTPTEQDKVSFTDVKDNGTLYPYHFIAVAAKDQIINGYPDNTFKPNNNVTRAQVITMIIRGANKFMPGRLKTPPSSYKSYVNSSFSAIHGESLKQAQYNCILTGLEKYDYSWNPWENSSRGEVSKMLWNLLNNNGQTEAINIEPVTLINGDQTHRKMVENVIYENPRLLSYIQSRFPNFYIRVVYGGHVWPPTDEKPAYMDVNQKLSGKEFTDQVAFEFCRLIILNNKQLTNAWLEELTARGFGKNTWEWGEWYPLYGQKDPYLAFTVNAKAALFSPKYALENTQKTLLARLPKNEMLNFLEKNGVSF